MNSLENLIKSDSLFSTKNYLFFPFSRTHWISADYASAERKMKIILCELKKKCYLCSEFISQTLN